MTILMVLWDFSGGGAERVAVLLANAFKAAGHDLCLVVARDQGPNRTLARPDVPILSPPTASPGAVLRHLRRQIVARRPDVVLSHQTTRNVLAILAHLATPGRATRIVVGVEHGDMAQTSRQTRGLGLKAFFHAARFLYPLTTGLAAVSDGVADSVRRHVRPFPVRLKTLPNPVVFPGFLDRVLENPRHPFLCPKTGPVFVAVGRLERQKDHALLIRAFSVLLRSMPARLIIFGEGSLRAAIEAQRGALGLEREIDLPGYVDNPLAAMRAADALVLSSHWEGLPTVAIEAMACGTQVVSTDNSVGIRAILRDGEYGWITPPDDAEALAEAMAQSIQAPKNTAALTARAGDFEAGAVAGLYLSYFKTIGATKLREPV